MRLFEIISEASPNSASFKGWFSGSKVRDTNGQPLLCYHATYGNFAISDAAMPMHFGTLRAAQDRAEDGRIIQAYLAIRHPYEYQDVGDDEPGAFTVISDMLEKGKLSKEEFQEYRRGMSEVTDRPATNLKYDPTLAYFIQFMQGRGYDGLRYINTNEDTGSTSWVVFHASQIWRVS